MTWEFYTSLTLHSLRKKLLEV